MTATEIEMRIERSHAAFLADRSAPLSERRVKMMRLADLLTERKPALARTMALEMGKPLAGGRAEVDKCAWVCRHYAEHAEEYLASEHPQPGAELRFFPMGPLFAVMPFNYPLWQLFRFAAPNVMAGNTVLLKHAESVTQCAFDAESLFVDAGFRKGTVEPLLLEIADLPRVIADTRVRGVTLTGSRTAARSLASLAGANLKKVVLELGGVDAFIVTKSANIESAVRAAVTSRMQNSGQACISAKRIIVDRERAEEFSKLYVEASSKLKVGDPLEEGIDLGPLAKRSVRDAVAKQVSALRDHGDILLGGEPGHTGVLSQNKGYFFPPTVVAVRNAAAVRDDEIFGPVAAILTVNDLSEAIALANDTALGLGSAIFSGDESEIARAITELEAGLTFVNKMVASEPGLPFGGVKESGIGRELGRAGMHEFMNLKTIVR